MIRVGIVGATGYGGRELLRLLGAHPAAGVVACASTSVAGEALGDVMPAFKGLSDIRFTAFDPASLAESCDVVFVGVPGTQSMEPVTALRKAGVKVIDIGPDFRLLNLDDFKTYYKAEHTATHLLSERVYGLVPWNRTRLQNADLVAVPGCYPASAILPLKPLVPEAKPEIPIVIDSISGVSGAGKGLKQQFHFPEMNENVFAYKVGTHQHTPEIEQELGGAVQVQFTPHVGPFTRGILTTITIRPTAPVNPAAIYSCYDEEPFVRVLGDGQLPDLGAVRGANFCDIGWVHDERTGNLIVVSAIDNLVGGTAGMAIQCMNIMFGLDETSGLAWGGMSV